MTNICYASDWPSNIMKVYGMVQDRKQWLAFQALELLGGEDLQAVLANNGNAPMSEDVAKAISIGIATGLEKLHELDIVHRDIKPENVFITAPGLRLIKKKSSRLSADQADELSNCMKIMRNCLKDIHFASF